MNISNKTFLLFALSLISLWGMYAYAYLQGSINTAETLDEIGHLQIIRIESTLNVIDALKQKTIIPVANNSAASVVDGVFFDMLLITKTLSKKQKNMICSKVNDVEVISMLKSDRLYGDPKMSWDQAGVKGVIEFCHQQSKEAPR